MFNIQHDRDLNHLEVKNSKNNIYAKICLNDGGSLQELVLNNHQIRGQAQSRDDHLAPTIADHLTSPYAVEG